MWKFIAVLLLFAVSFSVALLVRSLQTCCTRDNDGSDDDNDKNHGETNQANGNGDGEDDAHAEEQRLDWVRTQLEFRTIMSGPGGSDLEGDTFLSSQSYSSRDASSKSNKKVCLRQQPLLD